MREKYNVAVVGATGNVGREMTSILEQRDFPIDDLYVLASSRSKGKKINFRDQGLLIFIFLFLTIMTYLILIQTREYLFHLK
ncbi:MAG TPA: hypothetical protein EYQ87_00250 [Candidatus Nitrosopelagicus sp.]|nr:hypothetical protein [Candidatus Nitrosopelagicus sp.]